MLHSEVPENGNNSEMTKTKESTTHSTVSQRNVVESGYHQRQICEDNGTIFRKLSATPILLTGMLCAYRTSVKVFLKFLATLMRQFNSSAFSICFYKSRLFSLMPLNCNIKDVETYGNYI